MRRRGIIQAAVLVAALPPMARAQRSASGSRTARIGILWHLDNQNDLLGIYRDALVGTLSSLGYVDGKTVQFVERNSVEAARLREMAKELVDQAPDVLVGASQLTAVELKKFTTTIPI